jgi:hypothetical protein
MQTVRWGILGAANFARQHMAPAINEAEGAVLAALATSDAARAAPFAAIAPGLRVHSSYDALLADPEIDAVYVPLPNHLHVEWTLKALAAGKHVLTEKPIAMTATEIDRIIAARNSSGLLAAEAYMIVHHPQWQRARELVQDGAIGAVRHADAAFSYDNAADPGNIRNRPETGGGGIRDIGVYTYGSVRFVTGAEPDTLQARVIREKRCGCLGAGHRHIRGAGAKLHLFRHDVDAAFPPAGGGVSGRQGPDPPDRTFQRGRLWRGAGGTAPAGPVGPGGALPRRAALQASGRGVRAQRPRRRGLSLPAGIQPGHAGDDRSDLCGGPTCLSGSSFTFPARSCARRRR